MLFSRRFLGQSFPWAPRAEVWADANDSWHGTSLDSKGASHSFTWKMFLLCHGFFWTLFFSGDDKGGLFLNWNHDDDDDDDDDDAAGGGGDDYHWEKSF